MVDEIIEKWFVEKNLIENIDEIVRNPDIPYVLVAILPNFKLSDKWMDYLRSLPETQKEILSDRIRAERITAKPMELPDVLDYYKDTLATFIVDYPEFADIINYDKIDEKIF